MDKNKEIELRSNLYFRYKCLELMYSINKFSIENQLPDSLYPKFENKDIFHPTELNTLIFLLKSFKEIFEDLDSQIFEKNQEIFFFCDKFRNIVWHKKVYKNNITDLLKSDTIKKILSSNDLKKIDDLTTKTINEGQNVTKLVFFFERTPVPKKSLVLSMITENEKHYFFVKEEFLLLIFNIFNKSITSIFNYFFN